MYLNSTKKIRKGMTQDDVIILLELICNFPVIMNKQTNATTNKCKEDAWTALTEEFNSRTTSYPRQKEQLKLKWDNLKKAARNRLKLIEMNLHKPGGEKIHPDEILDKVATLMSSTADIVNSFTSEALASAEGLGSSVVEEYIMPETAAIDILEDNFASSTGVEDEPVNVSRSKLATTLYSISPSIRNKAKRRRKLEESVIERNKAITEYYKLKKEKLLLEVKFLKKKLK